MLTLKLLLHCPLSAVSLLACLWAIVMMSQRTIGPKRFLAGLIFIVPAYQVLHLLQQVGIVSAPVDLTWHDGRICVALGCLELWGMLLLARKYRSRSGVVPSEEPAPFSAADIPAEQALIDRRQHPRTQLDRVVPVQIQLLNRASATITGEIIDFSNGGLGLLASAAVAAGTPVLVTVEDASILAEVCHCRPVKGGFRLGLRAAQFLMTTKGPSARRELAWLSDLALTPR